MRKLAVVILCLFLLIPSVFGEDIEIVSGVVKLVVHDQSGTFTIYSCSPTTREAVPLMATYSYSSSTYFSVLIGNSIYKLIRDAGVDVKTARTDKGAQIIYTIKNKAEVTVDLSFWASVSDGLDDGLKIVVTAQNISDMSQNIAVKLLFDSSLGERGITHFSTVRRTTVNSELFFDSMNEEKWICSSDSKNAIKFLLSGNDITKTDQVAVAAKDILAMPVWTPNYQIGRSFNSILAYNNSAIGINWKAFQLTPLTKSSIRFYISTGYEGSIPADVSALDKANPIGEKSSLTENDEVTYTDESGTVFILGALTEEQLDPSYIEDLLKRIQQLQTTSIIDHDEITRLNAELDAILEKMRKQQAHD